MSTGYEYRPALGEKAELGTLYNARTGRFLPAKLFHESILTGRTRAKDTRTSTRFSENTTIEGKFKGLDINYEFGTSILSGLANMGNLEGFFMSSEKQNEVHVTIYYKIVATTVSLNDYPRSQILRSVRKELLTFNGATHVVASVELGILLAIDVCKLLPGPAPSDAMDKLIKKAKKCLEYPEEAAIWTLADRAREESKMKSVYSIKAYIDGGTEVTVSFLYFQDLYNHIDSLKSHVIGGGSELAQPIGYQLLPVSLLPLVIPRINTSLSPAFNFTGIESCVKVVQLFDELQASRLKLQHHQQLLQNRGRVNKCGEQPEIWLRPMLDPITATKADYNDELQILIKTSTLEHLSPNKVVTLVSGQQRKLNFVMEAVKLGATYIGYNDKSLNEIMDSNAVVKYIFTFGRQSFDHSKSWNDNHNLLLELLNYKNLQTVVAIVDCDAINTKSEDSPEEARIIHLQYGIEITDDLFAHRQFLAEKRFARYLPGALDDSKINKLSKRRFLKISCPGARCDSNRFCEWNCSRCLTPLEYGYTDRFIYCDCGRGEYTGYEFRCNGKQHGWDHERFDPDVLLAMLQSLDAASHLNILVLGETGVGKSTFINALVNYLTFDSLDEALRAEKLNCVVPCSFFTQVMDRTIPNGTIEQKQVQVGNRNDENDGSNGQSATQQTMVYPVMYKSSMIRLIDTPGIGDTRGLAFDRANMADVLSTLSGYDELHGILILLKSNNARLTAQFAFCIQELLTHLHVDAAQNVVFGFTNTRVSNYTPGDTLKPLENLLKRHENLGLKLKMDTTYCFDSESFRYLAAYKNEIILGNKKDFERSWNHSMQEATRLVAYFRTRVPHKVHSTINLNSARELISELTKPMAEISQTIQSNIALLKDESLELTDKRTTGAKLQELLRIQKIQLNAHPLDRPRTVCSNAACTEIRDDGNGENKKVTLYKAHCHAICYLENVVPDQINHSGLRSCAAFQQTEFCKSCKHHWQEHLHVLYELHEETVTVTDPEIERQINSHTNELTLKQTAIASRQRVIQEYEAEQARIQDVAAHFGVFLKKWSIRPYNDATVAYLKILIRDEEFKVGQGGSNKKLGALQKDLEQYQQLAIVLEKSMSADPNLMPLSEAGVTRLVQELYRLKHFGEMLKSVKQVTTAAHQATYRELPFTVKTQRTWSLKSLITRSDFYKQLGRGLLRQLPGAASGSRNPGNPMPMTQNQGLQVPGNNSSQHGANDQQSSKPQISLSLTNKVGAAFSGMFKP